VSTRTDHRLIGTKNGIIAAICVEGDLASFNRERGYLSSGGGCFRCIRFKFLDMKYIRHEVAVCSGYWAAAYRRNALTRRL